MAIEIVTFPMRNSDFSHEKCWLSIARLVITRGYFPFPTQPFQFLLLPAKASGPLCRNPQRKVRVSNMGHFNIDMAAIWQISGAMKKGSAAKQCGDCGNVITPQLGLGHWGVMNMQADLTIRLVEHRKWLPSLSSQNQWVCKFSWCTSLWSTSGEPLWKGLTTTNPCRTFSGILNH